MTNQKRWPGARTKLRAISRISRSRLANPSAILMIAKGTSTNEITNTTVTSEMPNQMIARKVQPTPEKEFKNGVTRS